MAIKQGHTDGFYALRQVRASYSIFSFVSFRLAHWVVVAVGLDAGNLFTAGGEVCHGVRVFD
jgi:hypothetical protein